MQNLPIHIAFCVNDGYVPYITVTIKSIMENNSECDVFIHVLIDSISDFNQKRLLSAIDGYENVNLQIHKVDDTPLRGLKTGRWTIYAWYRLLLPAILPEQIKRVLYLDADTLVVADIRELFAIDMTGKAIAAALDTTFVGDRMNKQYICSGVLLINLEYWRENDLTNKMILWANKHYEQLLLPDQDTINHVCQEVKLILPFRFNISYWYFVFDYFYQVHKEQLYDCLSHPVIIHYAAAVPWIKDTYCHIMKEKWIIYNKMLRYPVKSFYKSKGWLLIKIVAWNWLHPFKKRESLIIADVKKKLSAVKNR